LYGTTLSKILATPWNARDAWHLECELVDGVCVLNVLEPEECVRREANRERIAAAWNASDADASDLRPRPRVVDGDGRTGGG
jgi:hypothetical protein